jgi:hypothetical protein
MSKFVGHASSVTYEFNFSFFRDSSDEHPKLAVPLYNYFVIGGIEIFRINLALINRILI